MNGTFKHRWSVCLLALLVIVIPAWLMSENAKAQQSQQPQQPQQEHVGRYQIVQVKYDALILDLVSRNKGNPTQPTQEVWLLDTATGSTWKYERTSIVEPGKPVTNLGGWVPIEINATGPIENAYRRFGYVRRGENDTGR